MKEIFTGIYAQHIGSAFAGLVSDLYAYSAPEGVEKPFAVFQLVSDVPDYTFNTEFEDVLVQFNLFSDKNSLVEVNNIFDALKTTYDDCKLSVSGYTLVRMQRDSSVLIRDVEEGVWQYSVQYKILIEKN